MAVAGFGLEDELGIVYLVENAQQFWSELEDTLDFPKDHIPSLSQLDSALKRFVRLCATYHEQYLQSPLQLEHACGMILDSELFAFHSERMCELLSDDIQSATDPHTQFVIYNVLLNYGRRRSDFFRSHKRWQPLVPLLMDHVQVDVDPEAEDIYFGHGASSSSNAASIPTPIEVKLRSLGVNLLYEVCRVQKLSMIDLRMFTDSFLDYLFDLVELTRDMQDENFNYSVIRLICALNEQFMVATVGGDGSKANSHPESKNRVIRVLIRRLGSSKTFGENMIFMLNRAGRTSEDSCMQLLVLKILYILFTTNGTSEYFYTNDLCVLVDVFLRELSDLDEESESLRHTYLRVLHPLLTRTQLRDLPYKRPQIVTALESLIENYRIQDVNATTKRLVERCLAGEWCVQLRKNDSSRGNTLDSASEASLPHSKSQLGLSSVTASAQLERTGSLKSRNLKASKSVENLNKTSQRHPTRSTLQPPRRGSNASGTSLAGVASAKVSNGNHLHPKRQDTAESAIVEGTFASRSRGTRIPSPEVFDQVSEPNNKATNPLSASPKRRSAPAPPPKRRKPPAIPSSKTISGVNITTIKSSKPPH